VTILDGNGARRRKLLAGVALAPLAFGFTRPALAGNSSGPATVQAAERFLAFHNLHTEERLRVTYFADGAYIPGALARVDRLLRDFRTGDVHPIDPRLLDTLYALAIASGCETFEIISGYRSPQTNALLRRTSAGVASHSLHMDGRAIDVRVTGLATARLRDAAIALGRGGVGYYPGSDFVHLDTGRFRTWGPKSA
jgi:uncharacterized protein YcbK (DUF882 family)